VRSGAALASAAVVQANGDSAHDDPLALDAETMRAIGHQTVDLLADMLCDAQAPALSRATPEEMARRVDAAAPEIAAVDWGAGYGYARSATVTAVTPLRLLALGPADFGPLMREVPEVARRIERARRERLGRSV
jgi:hypothetical protein